jgi:hypothetical protein
VIWDKHQTTLETLRAQLRICPEIKESD